MSWQTREKVLATLLAAFALALGALIAWILIATQQFRPCQSAAVIGGGHQSNANNRSSAGSGGPTLNKTMPKASTEEGWIRAARYLRESINFNVDPCDDFYQYACGSWIKLNPLPTNKDRQDAFSLVRDKVKNNTRRVLESIKVNIADDGADPEHHHKASIPESVKMLKATYDACMNTEEGENLRSAPLLKLIHAEGGWPLLGPSASPWRADAFSPEYTIGRLSRYYNVHTLMGPSVYADQKNTSYYALFLDQAVLSFGQKSEDYYLKADDVYNHTRRAYIDLMKRVVGYLRQDLGLATATPADDRTFDSMLQFEIQLAGINTPAEQRRNETAMYNKWTIGKLRREAPIDWARYFRGLDITDRMGSDSATLIVVEPNYVRNLSDLLRRTDKRTLANYLIWRLVLDRIAWLDDRFVHAAYDFLQVLKGSSVPKRWDTCMGYVIGEPDEGREFLGYAAGRVFVDHYFSPQAKSKTQEMVQNLISAFERLLDNLTWMDNATKTYAKEKSQTLRTYNSVGYPDFIKDDRALDEYYKHLREGDGTKMQPFSDKDSFFEMNTKTLYWMVGRQFKKLGQPFDRSTFGGSPAIVNAWYSSIKNSIAFPAGILQPPFFDAGFPMAINYGAMGSVIGHEITHGFDDQGAQSDKDGNLHDWWTPESDRQFRTRTDCISRQYSKFCYHNELGNTESACVKGPNTLGENIADNGGLKQAFTAYQEYLRKHPSEQVDLRLPSLEHFTMEQLFFLSFASFWCGEHSDRYLRNLLATNEHSPGKYRVIGTLQNFPDFAKAFNCPVGSFMNPVNKCSVW